MGSKVITSHGYRIYTHPASEKKHSETVVFIHHMGGNHNSTWRHVRHLNDQGYDCISFDLLVGSRLKNLVWHPKLSLMYKGVFYLWSQQIIDILNFVESPKIVYAFSGPSLSAFWACHKRTDILKFICDGGPFHNIYSNTRNFFYHEMNIKTPLLNKASAFIGSSIWGLKPLGKLHHVLNQWPQHIPILSIRGTQDPIVAIKSIDRVFSPHHSLSLQVFEMPEGKHLDGLKNFPELYTQTLHRFLQNGAL